MLVGPACLRAFGRGAAYATGANRGLNTSRSLAGLGASVFHGRESSASHQSPRSQYTISRRALAEDHPVVAFLPCLCRADLVARAVLSGTRFTSREGRFSSGSASVSVLGTFYARSQGSLLAPHSATAAALKTVTFQCVDWWAHKDSNLGPAD